MYTFHNDHVQRRVSMFFFMFFLMFVSLTSVSIYLWVNHRRNRLIYWASLVILCAGLAGLQMFLEKSWVPYATEQVLNVNIIRASTIVTSLLNMFINTFPYYGMLLFYLIYNGIYTYQKWIPILASIPPVLTLLFYTDLMANRVDNGFVAAWGLCYVCLIASLAVRPIIQADDFKERVNHASIAIVFLVPLITLNIYHFSSSPVSDQLMAMIPYICITSLLLITIFYLRDAFLGVRRKSIHTVHVGTGLIHHSLKNSIGKIKLNALNIRKNVQAGQYQKIEAYVENLLHTHESMMAMMAKVSYATSDKLGPKQEMQDISVILDEVLESVEALPNIRVEKQYVPTFLFLDRILIAECLQNICNNAVEAMRENGSLHIALEKRAQKVLLTIRDTGHGMNSIQLQNIFEPFYSTKHRSGKHFGLGMYQVKKVIEAHRGKVEVRSTPNKGTVIVLTFPSKG